MAMSNAGCSEVPVEWLKSEWRKRGLLKRVPIDHQWLRWIMRCTQCGRGYKLIGHRVAGEYC